jgi:hypothetical protein
VATVDVRAAASFILAPRRDLAVRWASVTAVGVGTVSVARRAGGAA